MTVYKRADGNASKSLEDDEVSTTTGLGYNPATVVGGFTDAQARSVRSQKSISEWAMGERGAEDKGKGKGKIHAML